MAQTRSGKGIPLADSIVYRRRYRFRGWTREINFEHEHRLAGRIFPTWSHADHEDAARAHEKWSCEVAEDHGCLYEDLVRRYGKPPRLISGLVSPIFPANQNDKLRELAHLASTHRSIAHSHWKAAGRRRAFSDEFGTDWQYSMPCKRKHAG
jgi:hypothetical protein